MVNAFISVLNRRRRYVHRSKLDWDVHSSSGRYVRKHCKPLKVIEMVMEKTTNSFSSSPSVYNWRKVQFSAVNSKPHLWPTALHSWRQKFRHIYFLPLNIYVKANSEVSVCQEQLQISKSSLPACAGHPAALSSQTQLSSACAANCQWCIKQPQ